MSYNTIIYRHPPSSLFLFFLIREKTSTTRLSRKSLTNFRIFLRNLNLLVNSWCISFSQFWILLIMDIRADHLSLLLKIFYRLFIFIKCICISNSTILIFIMPSFKLSLDFLHNLFIM